jgi:hypothetical protein
MRKLLSLVIALLLVGSFAQAQDFPSQIWHQGKIFLTSGENLSGKVKYDLEANVVQLHRESMETFSATSVDHFEIFDEIYGGIRTFYSLPYAVNTDYQVPIFFELLVQGEDITLLCREYITSDSRGMGRGMYHPMYMNPMYGMPMMNSSRLAFDFYFLEDSGIKKYGQKRKELLEFMDDKSDEVKLFIRKNRLSHDKRGDLLRITAYYNQLKESS